ncbi:MAG: hypothetical protein HKN72_11200 [Gemmatimonadetes bacterium]|nr:Ig-like domain-containing protein [Gemmatimonadota bacterium]NNF13784.1 hypothetical protein [Gemmatimonadota bacterium]
MPRGATLSTLALFVLVAAAGCGGSSPSDPDPVAVASVDVAPASSDILVGETVQLTATPKGANGETLTGRTVTWNSQDTDVATVSSSGLVTGVGEGVTDITATSDGRAGSAEVSVSPVPVATVELDPPGPVALFTGETAQFTATMKDIDGNVLSDREVTWSTDDEAVASVDTDGLVTGESDGSAEVTATSEGISAMAAVEVSDPGPVFISMVTPTIVVEGQTATITGSGFHPTPSQNSVTVDGVAATVTQATTSTLEITVPVFACAPKRGADVVVSVGAETSPAEGVTVSPPDLLSMAVGDQITLTDPSALCLQFDEQSSSERYLIGVQSVSEVESTLTGVRIEAVAGAGPSPQLLPPEAVQRSSARLTGIDHEAAARAVRHRVSEMAYMDRARDLIEPLRRATPFRPTPAYRTGPALIPGDVTEGTELTVRFPDFSGDFCNSSTDITVIVRKVSARAIIVEDVDNPVGGFTAPDFDDMGADFDGTIYSTVVDYFGEPTDMDANSRIVIVLSKMVNELNGPAGFAGSVDLTPASQCPASNEGEFFFGRVPDPSGLHGDPVALDAARLFLRSLVAHEFAHIIQLSRRMDLGGQFMSSFMAEGGATAAEQYSGFAFEGRGEGQNYDNTVIYPAFGGDPHGYYQALGDLVAYFGHDFASGRNADAPEQCSWVGTAGETSGPCFGPRLVYGVTFSLIQHAIDLYGAGLGGPQAVQRALVDYTGGAGFQTLAAVFGVPVAELMATWAPMLYIDDRFVDPLLDDFQFPNWNLRSLEDAWGAAEAALQPRARTFGDFMDDVSVRSASTAFFDVSAASRPATAIGLTDLAGQDLPGTFQVFIVRVQ